MPKAVTAPSHPSIYPPPKLLSLGITGPIKLPALGPLPQVLFSAQAPDGALCTPSTRGANDLLSSHCFFPRTPGFCSGLLFAGFRSHHISPGHQTTLVYPITVNSQQSSRLAPPKQKMPSAKKEPIHVDPGIGWGQHTLQASTQAHDSVFILGHMS